jgi:hypothetical protein
MENKTCSKCGVSRPLADFYLSRGTPRSVCKTCQAMYSKERYLNAKPPHGEDKKWCRCGETKPLAEFNLKPQAACKACINVYQAVYREQNKRRLAERELQRYHSDVERYRALALEWRKKNRDKTNAKQRLYSKREDRLLADRLLRLKYSKELTDGYVRRALVKRSGLLNVTIPHELIGAKRLQLQILRKITNDSGKESRQGHRKH